MLPFANLGADKGDEYLGDGITEELLNALCKVKGLRVPGRSSSFAFKGKTGEDIFRQVGEKLKVSTVLEGSVRRAGDKLRITAQLINVADGFHLWSETFDRDMNDILAIQTEVAQRVVHALQLQLGGEEARALAKKPTENPEAHRLYLLGRHHFGAGEDQLATAMDYFQRALQLDPRYALAYCGVADVYDWMGGKLLPGREAWAKGREMAEAALRIDPDLADAHASLATFLADTWQWDAAEKTYQRALALNPSLAWSYQGYAYLLAQLGRFDESIAKQRKAIELEPLSVIRNRHLGIWLRHSGKYAEAIAQLQKAVELNPRDPNAHYHWGYAALGLGDNATARAKFEHALSLEWQARFEAALGYWHATNGNEAEAQRVLRRLDAAAQKRYVSPGASATIYIGLGEKARALDLLEKCFDEQGTECLWFKIDRLYDPLRAEPRFKALLKKVGLDK